MTNTIYAIRVYEKGYGELGLHEEFFMSKEGAEKEIERLDDDFEYQIVTVPLKE